MSPAELKFLQKYYRLYCTLIPSKSSNISGIPIYSSANDLYWTSTDTTVQFRKKERKNIDRSISKILILLKKKKNKEKREKKRPCIFMIGNYTSQLLTSRFYVEINGTN